MKLLSCECRGCGPWRRRPLRGPYDRTPGNRKGAGPPGSPRFRLWLVGPASPGKGGRPQSHGFKTRSTRPFPLPGWTVPRDSFLRVVPRPEKRADAGWTPGDATSLNTAQSRRQNRRFKAPDPGWRRGTETGAGTRDPAPGCSLKSCVSVFQLPVVPSIRSHPKTQQLRTNTSRLLFFTILRVPLGALLLSTAPWGAGVLGNSKRPRSRGCSRA